MDEQYAWCDRTVQKQQLEGFHDEDARYAAVEVVWEYQLRGHEISDDLKGDERTNFEWRRKKQSKPTP
jgi:hypothetical protein